MTIVQKQFLELLRSGLWGRPADASLFQGDVDWKAIFRIAKEQTVQIIVADGMETLPRSLTPKKQTIYKVAIKRTTNSLTHKFLNSTINRITNALDAAGIPSVLLKGQGVAQNYLNPESRMCGDIDIYVGMENFERACDVLMQIEPDRSELGLETDRHRHINIDGAEIEVHHTIDHIRSSRQNDILELWGKNQMPLASLPATTHIWRNDDTDICLPPHTYNAFFILHHGVRHFISEGVGLRHICDWIMYIHKHHEKIDAAELSNIINALNMMQVWQEFSILATQVLGLPVEELPIALKKTASKKTHRFLQEIFYSGNFGKYATEKINITEKNVIKRKWHNFWFQTSRLFKLHRIFPAYTRTFAWGWLTNALYRFFTRQ